MEKEDLFTDIYKLKDLITFIRHCGSKNDEEMLFTLIQSHVGYLKYQFSIYILEHTLADSDSKALLENITELHDMLEEIIKQIEEDGKV